MSEEFGTVNLKRSDRAREIEMIRQQYRKHRDALSLMANEAPTERLAQEYRRLVNEIDNSFSKLDELERRGVLPETQPLIDTPPRRTEPGTRPLVAPPVLDSSEGINAAAQTRLIGIVLGGIILLGLLGWVIWKVSSNRREAPPAIVEQQSENRADVESSATPAVIEALSAEPSTHDYGSIRRGTRAARQFEIANNTDSPVSIQVERSECRCLFYDYAPVIPPKGKETITVTVDGGKAKSGKLLESIRVSSKSDSAIGTTMDINAVIQ